MNAQVDYLISTVGLLKVAGLLELDNLKQWFRIEDDEGTR